MTSYLFSRIFTSPALLIVSIETRSSASFTAICFKLSFIDSLSDFRVSTAFFTFASASAGARRYFFRDSMVGNSAPHFSH